VVFQKLGQHFLKDSRALERIVSVLDIKKDVVVEIGPGHGELTKYIVKSSPKKLIAIEKDGMLASKLKDLLSQNDTVEIIIGDALRILPALPKTHNLKRLKYKLVGNIPYYITGHLLRTIGEMKIKPERIVLTMQKEVAERLCAEPPYMNLLAASVQFWGKTEIIRYISKKSFRPQPHVNSAIVKITPYETESAKESIDYYKFIKILFAHPRKTALNNIRDGLDIERILIETELKKLNLNQNLRPQNLNTETIKNLSLLFTRQTK
jgi:16S rRNA (adenine1518-N6/adenine1519-N6)-dimethyltransferase